MKNTNIEQMSQFLLWFGNQRSIPLQVRHDFFQHIVDEKGFDDKAIAFVEQTLKNLKENYQAQYREWQALSGKLGFVSAISKHPKYSLKERIVSQTKDFMFRRVESFKKYFSKIQKKEISKQESAEERKNAVKIAQLKASIS